jgi:hypothetical protein
MQRQDAVARAQRVSAIPVSNCGIWKGQRPVGVQPERPAVENRVRLARPSG